MKSRPSLTFLCGVCAILLAVTGGVLLPRAKTTVAARDNPSAANTRSGAQRVERAPSAGGRERHQVRQEVCAMKEKLLLDFPQLPIEGRPVPDEENGFLQLQLAADLLASISGELLDLISGRSEWDSGRVAELLAAHADLVAQVEAIAALEKRSSTDLPSSYRGFDSARTAKHAAELLLAKARLASEAGDEAAAFRLAALTRNLVSHFTEVETRTLLMETVAILSDLTLQKVILEKLLPNLSSSADADAWMALLKSRNYGPSEFSKLVQGEWHSSMDFLPDLLMNPQERPPDWQEMMRAHAGTTDHAMRQIQTGTFRELYGFEPLHHASHHPKLSIHSRETLDQLSVGLTAWSRGYVRAAVVVAMNRAVMELALLERAGEPLSAANVSSVTRNPYDGTVFAFDPATRSLSLAHPTEGIEVDPVKLPW
jgi:hypothetical protein